MPAELIGHFPCPCGTSSDAFAHYDNGWGHCFRCSKNIPLDKEGEPSETKEDRRGRKVSAKDLIREGTEVRALRKRKISEETCKKFGYLTGTFKGKPVQIAQYVKNGRVVAQKLRDANKKMVLLGDTKDLPLFGMHLWNSGKILVITEGEIDAMSVSQAQGNKFAVVSVPNGASSAAKSIAQHLDYVDQFDRVVLMFDMDEPGREASQEAAEVLPPGKAYIAELPLKDPNEVLVEQGTKPLVEAIWQAKPWRPDGVVGIGDIKDKLFKPVEWGKPWPWQSLTEFTYGRRPGEIYMFGAGVGIGKTDVFTQTIAFDITELNEKVGIIYLEQPVQETVQRIAGKIDKRQYHIPDGDWEMDDYKSSVDRLIENDHVRLYQHFGSKDWETIKRTLRFFATYDGITHVYIDHLTALVANAEDERRALDALMADMAGIAQELGLIIHCISHLTTPEGKSHEEGGRVMEKHFTGSRAIARWSHFMIGLERNKQAEDPAERQTTTVRVLKDRYTGRGSGRTMLLRYDHGTGHLSETDGFTAGEDDWGDDDDIPF